MNGKKTSYGSESKIHYGLGYIDLSDNLSTGRSAVAVSNSGRPYGILSSKEIRQAPKWGRRNPVTYIYRAGYIAVVGAITLATIIWG